MRKLEGKVALLTGASKGIGAGIAKALAAEGAAVAVKKTRLSATVAAAARLRADSARRFLSAIRARGATPPAAAR